MLRKFFRRKPKAAAVDEESQFLWDRLRFLQDDDCCKAMRYMRDHFDGTDKIRLIIGKDVVKELPVNYCPRCGRRL